MGRNIFVVHRIDKSVSGLILFTKNIEAQRHLENNWKSYTKQYYAIVEKKISPSQKILKNKLTTNGPNLVFINDNAQNAVEVITEYETIKSDERYSELLITLHTGKKNQIRAQLSHHGNPIIGDTKFSSNYPLKKYILLHSWRISLTLPDSTKAITLEACIPDYFKNYQPKGQTNENT